MENLVIEGPGYEKVSLYHPTKEEADADHAAGHDRS